jgi:hypothetical protein
VRLDVMAGEIVGVGRHARLAVHAGTSPDLDWHTREVCEMVIP